MLLSPKLLADGYKNSPVYCCTSATLHKTRHNSPGWQPGERSHRCSNSSGPLSSLKSRGGCICHFCERPGTWEAAYQRYIYARVQHRAQLGVLKAPKVLSLDTWEWRRPWHGPFPITRVTYVAKPAENFKKLCAGSSSLRVLERRIPCHFHHQHHC